MEEHSDTTKKSILPLSGKEKVVKKQVVKTTIVGGQPPGNERPLQEIPVGIEEVLAMAAVDDRFASSLYADRESAMAASGVSLTATEKMILSSIERPALAQMVSSFKTRLPVSSSRREFLKKSASAALLALVGGGILSTAAQGALLQSSKGIRPDRPPAPGGALADRPKSKRKIPSWTAATGSIPEDEEAAKKATVFENFPATAGEKKKKPFLIYFYVPGEDDSKSKVKACIKFEKALAAAAEFPKVAGDFGRYKCDTEDLDKKLISKYRIKTPCIIFFDAMGKRVHRITVFPKDDESLAKRMKKIKEKSDKAAGIEPESAPQPSEPASRGHRADRPPKKK